jgi:hypothetical protein
MEDYFDWKFYINKYKDLKHLNTKEKAFNHWIKYGMGEKRICNSIFINVNFLKYANDNKLDYNNKNVIYKHYFKTCKITQSIKKNDDNIIKNFNNISNEIYEENDNEIKYLKYSLFPTNAFIIGIYGDINIDTYPILIIEVIKKLREIEIDAYLMIFNINDIIDLPDELYKYLINNKWINKYTIDEKDIYKYIKICDLITLASWNNYIYDGEYISKILYNVPIICNKNINNKNILDKKCNCLIESIIKIPSFNYKKHEISLDEYYEYYYKLLCLPNINKNINDILFHLKSYYGFINLKTNTNYYIKQNIKNINLITCVKKHYINTIKEYVSSFKLFSKNNLIYYDFDNINDILKISNGILLISHEIIHNLCHLLNNNKYNNLLNFLKNYKELKICFIQDDYYDINYINFILNYTNINIVFTCIKGSDIFKIYKSTNIIYKNIFTGYTSYNNYFKKINDKTINMFYRGKTLNYIYGELGQDKLNIGIKMKKICEQYNISNDIEWDDDKRIYTEKWLEYLSNAKVTLGTLTGSNVLNYDYNKRDEIIKWLGNIILPVDDNSEFSYNNAKIKFDIKEQLNVEQISPKIFEAISVGTVLLMYEGNYGYILKPDIHYISLKKDYSNIEDVIKKIKDDEYLQNMADRAYNDIILSNKYSYEKFIKYVDEIIDSYE